ncbi:hypothetical protein MSAN_02346200 [Mycena sanguinolenta]|uniref:Uncharacterized protein n=1 Tax=Mycena sanguinolenta TaxID=230812 RepID=A0A8H6X6Y7_9AGAR|nr:hypothetical protein MSAN_02346200 [Mycena sanguinolenta]
MASSPFSRIPAELWAIICDEVHNTPTLASLCRISSNSRLGAEALRILYHSVDLRDCPTRVVQSWSRTIMNNTSLAERVHALALRLPSPLRFEVSDATKIGCALGKCVNLKELRVFGELLEKTGTYQNDGIHGWLINDCSFRLTKFESFYFEDRNIERFWRNQTEIQLLAARTSSCLRDPEVLPQVIALRTDLLDFPEGRALQRISTRLEDRYIQRLARSTAVTLTTLYLSRDLVDRFSLGDAIAAVAKYFVDLIHLVIVEQKKCHVALNEKLSTTTLQKFSKLESLVLRMLNVASFEIDDVTHKMNTAAGVYGLGHDFMIACPTLQRAAVSAEVEEQVLASVVTRSQGGEIHEGSGTVVDFDASDMFWNQ